MNDMIAAEHEQRNLSTRNRWEAMASHRKRVTEVLGSAAQSVGSADKAVTLCVLGAGNCNDIDLNRTIRDYQTVTLIDLDEAALKYGVESQSPNLAKIELRSGVDVTGVLGALESLNAVSADELEVQIESAIQQAGNASIPFLESYDVVCSSCLISQLIDSVVLALPPDHPRLTEFVLRLRDRHLDLILDAVKPGGLAILISDFVSTTTAPELPELDDEQIGAAAQHWIRQGNFFTGLNPFAILKRLESHERVARTQLLLPWRWSLGTKQFAVFGCIVEAR